MKKDIDMKKLFFLSLIFCNLTFLQAANSTPQNQNGTESSVVTTLRKVITAAFSGKYNDVSVTLNKGGVSLSGSVASQEDKENLEQLFRSVGLKNIDNQIIVRNR